MNEEEIIAAREHWRKWAEDEQRLADKGWATQESARTGFRVVEAYDMQLKTGVPHCSCCLKPVRYGSVI